MKPANQTPEVTNITELAFLSGDAPESESSWVLATRAGETQEQARARLAAGSARIAAKLEARRTANKTPKAGVVKYAVYLGNKKDLGGLITPNKKYEVIEFSRHHFKIVNDKGHKVLCLPSGCAFLDGDDWTFTYSAIEHPEPGVETCVEYTGHHGTSGLQGHSIGDEYPFVIYKVGHSDGPDKWAVLDGSTGHYYPERFDTYPQAQGFIKELNNAL